MIRSVVFDVGETLLDDTAEWGRWADWLQVPRHTFSAVMGALGAAGRPNGDTFEYFRSDFDLASERQRREDAGFGEHIREIDLYPDVRPALQRCRDQGYWVGVCGNQTARAAELLRTLDLPCDAVATSGEWGLIKPDPGFFSRLVDWAPGMPSEIVYVGDHRDYDVVGASRAGLRSAFVRRGPWGHLWVDDPVVRMTADWILETLTELPELLSGATSRTA